MVSAARWPKSAAGGFWPAGAEKEEKGLQFNVKESSYQPYKGLSSLRKANLTLLMPFCSQLFGIC
jgi:hypothetical protein